MNNKTKSILIPILVFVITVIVGTLIVFYSLNLDNKTEEVMGVNTEAVDIDSNPDTDSANDALKLSISDKDESLGVANQLPVCVSFKNITEKSDENNEKYLNDTSFSFEVVGYEPDAADSISSIKYSIIDSDTNSSVAEYKCSIDEDGKTFDDGSICSMGIVEDESSESSVVMYKSTLSEFKFPDVGDFFIKASIISSDGTFVKCVVSKDIDE